MMPNADNDFLLGLAGVSGTMLGTFIVGVFFYIDSEMHRRLAAAGCSICLRNPWKNILWP